MRRNYISPEYIYNYVNGTYNMLDQPTFFGSQMIEIEDELYIGDNDIIYYQNDKNEQINFLIENLLAPVIYNSSEDKKNNHELVIDASQTHSQKDNQTRWILDINLSNILSNYVFALLKRERTFEGIKNNMTKHNNVSLSIKDYIHYNIINRYKFSRIDLYLKYNDLKKDNVLRFKNNWNKNIINKDNLIKRFQTEISYDYSYLKVYFNQEKPSSSYSFDYYFNLLFEKI